MVEGGTAGVVKATEAAKVEVVLVAVGRVTLRLAEGKATKRAEAENAWRREGAATATAEEPRAGEATAATARVWGKVAAAAAAVDERRAPPRRL